MDHGGQSQTRRIQVSGGSTYIVSLPRHWIEELGISAGDSVTIAKNPNESLTLFAHGGAPGRKETAVITTGKDDCGDSIKRKIIAAYLDGYNYIRIIARGSRILPRHTTSVRDLVRTSMIGTEIVESSSEEITVQVLSRLPELSFETALERMYMMACNMIRESIDSLEEMDMMHADGVIGMDDEVDRFGLYMRRSLVFAVASQNALHELGLRKPSECLGYKAVISRIERIADHACLIAKRSKAVRGGIERPTMSRIRALSERALGVFVMSVEAVQGHDFEKGESVAESIERIIEQEKQIAGSIKESGGESTALRFILEDLRRIAEYSGDIAEVAIDENIQSVIVEG